jgi:2,4-dienoyl-CoA reductase-like NADH-dependent reductase (Old Yellow Enzyme family)/thioredoxin reductase
MSQKYKNLLSPIKIHNTVFKNRLIASRSSPTFIQAGENYPTEPLITHYANKAKNGMAVVTCSGVGMPHFIPESELPTYNEKTILPGMYDIENHHCQVYLSHLTDAIHFYGGKASMQIGGYVPTKYDVSTGVPSLIPFPGIKSRVGEEIPEIELETVADDFVRQAVIMKSVGFDMVYLHMAYRFTILGRFLSPLTNKRTDQFGGSVENRARFAIMVADRIKQACGKDFIIDACMSGVEPPGGITLEETIEFAKLFSGHIDLLQLRAPHIDPAHPAGFEPKPNPFLYLAQAVKESRADIAVVTIGGFQDPAVCEDVIASGKADFIAMARGVISNPEYGRMLYEGRGEDVVPCIRCNFCLRSSDYDPIVSVCSVNPTWGLEHKVERMIRRPDGRKKIAIVGGGPGGIKAALIANERGHDVTLYEKSNRLGGLLKTADNVSFKWPLKAFTEFLVRQIGKAEVEIHLNLEVTPEMIKKAGYDVILACVGSEPIMPSIPGIDEANIVTARDVFGHEDALAKNVVIIGGGEVGVETGMHLAEQGHQVTVLEMGDKLAPHSPPVHFWTMFEEAWEKQPGFNYILNARCTSIKPNKVNFLDGIGATRSIEAGTIVVAAGMKAKSELAMQFYGTADQFYMVGDCILAGNVQKTIRSAYSVASMI